MDWSDSKIRMFIVGVLRAGARRWPNKHETLRDAYVGKKENKKTGRKAMHYRCNSCKGEFPSSDVNVDHIIPVVDPLVGFIDWNTYIDRLFCSKENLQVLCSECHNKKTNEERNAKSKKNRKE